MKHLTVFFQRVIIYCVIFRERRKIRSAYVTIAQKSETQGMAVRRSVAGLYRFAGMAGAVAARLYAEDHRVGYL